MFKVSIFTKTQYILPFRFHYAMRWLCMLQVLLFLLFSPLSQKIRAFGEAVIGENMQMYRKLGWLVLIFGGLVAMPVAWAYTQISAGQVNTCGLRNDGKISCWGNNFYGQTNVPSGSFSQVAVGIGQHVCALKSDGSAVCWGENFLGEVDAPAGSFSQIATGSNYSCALKKDGSIVCWGGTSSEAPVGSFNQITVGQVHSCGLQIDGSVVCWGVEYGKATRDHFVQIAAGGGHTCGLKSDDSVVCWGNNEYGQINAPIGRFTQIAASYRHSCGLKSDSSVVCWGSNEYGQSNVPTGYFIQVVVGVRHTCALKSDGNAICWGDNASGQTNVPPDTSSGNRTCSYNITQTQVRLPGRFEMTDPVYYNSHTANAETGSATIVASDSSCTWNASSNDDWASITSGSSGTGNGTIHYVVQANAASSPRTGSLTIRGESFRETLYLNQEGGLSCNYTLSPTSRSHSANSETGSISVTASSNSCTWNASSDSSWASITSGNSGAGNGTVNYSVVANGGSGQRTATLIIAGQAFALTQNAPDSTNEFCTSGSANVNNLNCVNGNCSGIKISCNSQSCQWCDGSNNCGNILYNGKTSIPNGSITCQAGRCSYRTQIGGSSSSGSFSCKAQNVVACSYSLSPASRTHAANAETGSVTVTASDSSCSWDSSSDVSWASITSGSSNTGNGSVSYSIQANSGTTSRNGTLSIAGQTFSLTQSAAPLSGALSITPISHDFGSVPVLESTTETSVLPRRAMPTRNADYAPDRVIVKFRNGSTRDMRRASRGRRSAGLIRELPLINAEVWRVNDVNAAISEQNASPDAQIEYIEPDYKVTINATPNDPDFDQLWGLHNTGQIGGTADADIDASEAWDMARGSPVVCAVIDTGVDYNHPDLASNMWRNLGEIPSNGIDDDRNGYVDDVYGYDFVNDDGDPMDDDGHGTHVAGTIAGVGNNGIGVVGVNWSGKIMALKHLGIDGGSVFNAIRAIEYATQMGVKCTNNSWGGGDYSQALYDAIEAAGENGVLFMAAAGNGGDDGMADDNDAIPHYPSSYTLDNIITVCATDHKDKLAVFSNYGATSVDLCAPGVDILSTWPSNQYNTIGGTSMATPHVTGAVALLWGNNPHLTAAQVKAKIMAEAETKTDLQGSNRTRGRLNLHQTLVGVVQPEDFTVTNSGQAAVTLTQATLTGTNSAEFKILQNTCSGSLNPGASCTVTVSFAPVSAGGIRGVSKQAVLTIRTTNGQNASTNLSGNATNVIGLVAGVESSDTPSGGNVPTFRFAEPSIFNPQTGQALLPSLFVAGNTTQKYSVTLCLTGSAFFVCDMSEQPALPGDSELLGNAIFDPMTGIVEIPMIRVENSSGESVGVSPNAYSVKLQLVNGQLQLIDLTPIL